MSLLRPSSRIDTSATPTPFTELMALQALPPGGTGTTSGRFVSLTTPFVPMDIPGNEAPRTFGGHVYAQAILAAAQTVTPGQTLCVSNYLPWARRLQTVEYHALMNEKRESDFDRT